MTFPTDKSVAHTLGEIIASVADLKTKLLRLQAVLSSGSMDADQVLTVVAYINQKHDDLTSLISSIELSTVNDASINGAMTRLLLAIKDTTQWVAQNIPTDGTYLLLYSMDQDFKVVPRVFTGAAVTTFKTKIDAILAEIT